MFLERFHALLRAHRCLSVSSWDQSSNFVAYGLRWRGFLTYIFPNDGPFFCRILAWRSVDSVNITLWNWFQDFLDRVSRRLSTLRNECSWILWYTTQLWYTFHCSYSMLVVALSFLWQWSLFFGFLFGCSSNSWCGNKHLSPVLHPDSFFKRLGTRAGANIHKMFARKSSSNNICTVVEQWNHGYFCLGRFSSSTHFDLVARLAQKGVAAVCSGFCARSWVSWWKLHRLLANTGLFFPTGNWYLFPPSTPMNPFRFLTTAPDSVLPYLASKFRNRSFWAFLLFTIVFNFW